MRLNKYLATTTGISRREADELISSGKVLLNGNIIELGAQLNDGDKIEIDGKEYYYSENTEIKHLTILLNKPEGYVSSRNGQGHPTVYDLLPEKYQKLKTVGRLDQNSSGLILLTSDGDLAFQLTHPKFNKVKVYEIELDKPLEPLHQQMIADFGINLPDGISKLGLIKNTPTEFIVTMSEGRNRQIRRTFASLGYEVIKLHRTNFGPYNLGELKSGEFAEIK